MAKNEMMQDHPLDDGQHVEHQQLGDDQQPVHQRSPAGDLVRSIEIELKRKGGWDHRRRGHVSRVAPRTARKVGIFAVPAARSASAPPSSASHRPLPSRTTGHCLLGSQVGLGVGRGTEPFGQPTTAARLSPRPLARNHVRIMFDHCNVTPIGHNTEMTLFNWTDADDPAASGQSRPAPGGGRARRGACAPDPGGPARSARGGDPHQHTPAQDLRGQMDGRSHCGLAPGPSQGRSAGEDDRLAGRPPGGQAAAAGRCGRRRPHGARPRVVRSVPDSALSPAQSGG